MIEVNQPQVWTLIGVFAAALFAMMTLMSTMFVRLVRAEISGLGGRVWAEIGGVDGRISGGIVGLRGDVMAEIAGLRSEVTSFGRELRRVEDVLTGRLDHLDRDVNALTHRVFGDPPAA